MFGGLTPAARYVLLGGLVVALLASWLSFGVGRAGAFATSPCGTNGVFSQAGNTGTCSYTTVGEDTFAVPAGVTTLNVSATGAAGGNSGGFGAVVSNTALPVPSGDSQLYVDVAGQPPTDENNYGGGWPDGGAADYGHGGGGASAISTASRGSAALTGNPDTDSRLIVAGGGGGGAFFTVGGSAGDVTVTGAGSTSCGPGTPGANGGVGPTDGSDGSGVGEAGCGGADGSASQGGNGQWGTRTGAGGGGWFGGGGGGQDAGGGGGSSYAGAGTGTTSVATATSGTGSVSISWSYPPVAPGITSADSTAFVEGQSGAFTFTSTGSPTPSVSESGNLPSGVSFLDNGDGTANLTGTPAAGSAGSYPLTITAHNGVGDDATQSFTLNVGAAATITSAGSTAFVVGQSETFTVTSSGSPTPGLSESGSLPSGVTFTDNGDGTATLGGTPAAGSGGSYPLTITARNGVGEDATQSFTLTVSQVAAITSADNTAFVEGQSGAFTITSSGTPAPSLSESGSLPQGVSFTDNGDGTANLTGTPAAGTAGSYPLTITAHNGVGDDATQSFTLNVGAAATITSAGGTAFVVGQSGTFTLTYSGSPTPGLSESGSLPSGVTFTDNGDGTATLGGTPAAGSGGSYPLTITAHNGVGDDATQSFTLTVSQVAAITSADHTAFVEGQSGAFTITSSGSPMPSLSESGSLPSGVVFTDNGDGTGNLTGTPAAGSAGSYPLTITAHNGVGDDATQSFTLNVGAAATITSEGGASFAVGQSATFTLTSSGSPTPTLSESGSLPSGVTFIDNGDGTATLGGTPGAGSGGSYPLTITAHNGVGEDATQSFTLAVNEAAGITSANSTVLVEGQSGAFTFTSSGAPSPSLSESGALPSGVTFTDNGDGTGNLTGTPVAGTAGSYPLTITAHNGVGDDATQSFKLTVNSSAAITSATQATFQVGAAGTFTVTSTGSPAAALSESGSLPSGVSFTDNGDGTATLAGTPASGSGGSYPITITAHNGVGSDATQAFALTVSQAAAITSAGSTAFVERHIGAFTITSTGSPAPSLSESGNLPSGVRFTDNGGGTASLSGAPSRGTGGSYPITIAAHNGVGNDATQRFTLTVQRPPSIYSANAATFAAGQSSAFTVGSAGIPTPAVSESGTLPQGVTFKDNGDGTATLSGTAPATAAGSYPFTLKATNGVGAAASQAFTLTVTSVPAFTSSGSDSFVVGTAGHSFTVTTSGYPAPALSERGTLPSGLTFTNNGNGTATLSGTPAAGSAKRYPLTLTATSSSGTATQQFNLDVDLAPTITSASATSMVEGTPASFTLSSTGFPVPKLTASGTLPAGVSFHDNGDGTGTLSGTPQAGSAGSYPITLTASNGVKPDATQAFTLVVGSPLKFTSLDKVVWSVNASKTITIRTTGSPTPRLSYSGTLPSGQWQFHDNHDGTATLSGFPNPGSGGSYPITFTASNGVSADATQAFNLVVAEAPSFTSLGQYKFTVGQPDSVTITTQGYPTPKVTEAGGLPAGLTFKDNGDGTAVISGTPTAGGLYHLTLTAKNALATVTQDFALLSYDPAGFTSASSTTFQVGQHDTFDITTKGYPAPTTVWETGSLPPGVDLSNLGGGKAQLVGWSPAASTTGTYKITLGTSAPGYPNAYQQFTLTIGQTPAFTSAKSATTQVGQATNLAIKATGYPTPALSESGPLPVGMTFTVNGNGNGTLTGTPVAGSGKVYAFSLTATNGIGGPVTQTFTLTVNEPPRITSASSDTGFITSYKHQFTASGWPNAFTWSMPSVQGQGPLPQGLSLNANTGLLSGTIAPHSGGVYNVKVDAANGIGSPAEQDFTLTVDEEPSFKGPASGTVVAGKYSSCAIAAWGYPIPALTESIAAGDSGLPPGMSIVKGAGSNANVLYLRGWPAASGTDGTHTFTVSAFSRIYHLTVSQQFTVTVASPGSGSSSGMCNSA